MATDDERREVARRLRSFVTDDSVYTDVDACRVLYSIGLYYKDIDRIYFSGFDVARLADLIDPGESGQNLDKNQDSVQKESPIVQIEHECDRDALLELADELEEGDVTYLVSTQYVLDEYARRIREALGVQDA